MSTPFWYPNKRNIFFFSQDNTEEGESSNLEVNWLRADALFSSPPKSVLVCVLAHSFLIEKVRKIM